MIILAFAASPTTAGVAPSATAASTPSVFVFFFDAFYKANNQHDTCKKKRKRKMTHIKYTQRYIRSLNRFLY